MASAKKILWPVVASIAIAGGSYFGSMAFTHSSASAEPPSATAKQTETPHSETVAPAEELSQAFRSVHNAMKDAVVNISIVKKVSGDGALRRFHFPEGFPFPPGFGPNELNPNQNPGDNGQGDNGQGDDNPGGDQGGEEIQGTGSGVIVSPDGYILTNNHVVEDATTITVRLDDKRNYKAKVIGTDPKTDLAVVKIDADHLTYAKFGDSDATQVGDWVLAFGSPLGFEQTMTQGIISAKGRVIDIIQEHNPALAGMTYEDFLQTDAAINPGNSGGPLVNLQGEVIGINAAIASNTGYYNGIGFSIPSNEARYIMDSLIKHGKVVRGFLDVKIEDINNPAPEQQALVDSIKKSGFSGEGALVVEVDPQGPAGKGGVESGDVVTELDGKPIKSFRDLRNQIARTAPGTVVSLTVFRDGKNVTLKFPVGTQPATLAQATQGGESAEVGASGELGIRVQRPTAEVSRRYHLSRGRGVLVTDVSASSVAGLAGLQPGDVITSVNRQPVNSVEEFNSAVAKAKLSEGIRMTVRSQDGMDRLVFIEKK